VEPAPTRDDTRATCHTLSAYSRLSRPPTAVIMLRGGSVKDPGYRDNASAEAVPTLERLGQQLRVVVDQCALVQRQ
jgi:3-deoxy-D-arabino-heptulosonate 7-phosphate (DAHP) synthase